MSVRTTVRLSQSLLSRAKRKAAREGRTLTALIEEGLQRVLIETPPIRPSRVLPPISTATGGLMPGVDLADTAALQHMEDIDLVGRGK